MAKYKKRGAKAKERDRDDSTDGETESPAPPPSKKKKLDKKKGRGSNKKEKEEKEASPQKDEKPAPYDPKVPYTAPLKSLNPLVSCSLCNGYLIDATTISECLHTFCKSCLLRYFEEEDNCCPQCGQLVHQSHPTNYIAYDRTIQDVVYKLVPGLYEAELKQREQYVKQQKRQNNEDTSDDEEEEEKKRKKEDESERTNRCFDGNLKNSHHRNEPQMLIELMCGADDLPEPPKRFVRSGEMCTVTTLKRYLSFAMYGTKSRYMEMDLFCNNELMGRDFSMKFIHLTRCRKKAPNEPLRLVYKHRIEL